MIRQIVREKKRIILLENKFINKTLKKLLNLKWK
jgi:hypothetical protein